MSGISDSYYWHMLISVSNNQSCEKFITLCKLCSPWNFLIICCLVLWGHIFIIFVASCWKKNWSEHLVKFMFVYLFFFFGSAQSLLPGSELKNHSWPVWDAEDWTWIGHIKFWAIYLYFFLFFKNFSF